MSETFNAPAGAPQKIRRTRLLSRPGDQFRTTLVPTLGAAILLVLLLAFVHQANNARTAELVQSNPAFAEALESQSLEMETTLATASVIYLVGILLIGLIHSRRLIGALFAIHRRIMQLAEGDLATRFRLRRSDYFHDVADYRRWLEAAGYSTVRVELVQKDMVHQSPDAFRAWLRTTWHPFTDRLLEAEREPFIAAVAARYFENHTPDPQGQTHVNMVRLEVEATWM